MINSNTKQTARQATISTAYYTARLYNSTVVPRHNIMFITVVKYM